MIFAAQFFASYIFISLKCSQQLNVVRGNYIAILPTSLAMAACEVFVIANIASAGFGWIMIPIGLGSGLGALTSMFIHAKIEAWKR